jgi:pectin methylesterase-like acyl-CoA thioesterase
VRLFGNLYTALFDSPDPTVLSRVYVRNSYIAGDMQFITGRATLVIDNTEIHYLTNRLDTSLGSIMAASTAGQSPFGMLVFNSRFKIFTTTNSNWVLLGRSWDHGVRRWHVN